MLPLLSKSSSTAMNVVIMAVAVFHSGGVPIVPAHALTVLLLAMLFARVIIRGVFPGSSLVVHASIVATVLFMHFVASDYEQPPNEYILYLVHCVSALAMVLHYRYSGDDFARDLQLTLAIFVGWEILSFFVQFPLQGRITAFVNEDYEARTLFRLFWYPREADGSAPVLPFVLRCQGWFWEPGVQQIYANVLVFISLYIRRSNWLTAAGVFGVLATFSTTGYIVLCVVMLPAIAGHIVRRPVLAPIAAGVGILFFALAWINLAEKLGGSGSRSAQAREYDFRIGFDLVRERPWVGYGLNREQLRNRAAPSYLESLGGPLKPVEVAKFKGFTSSIVYLCCGLGVPLFAGFCACFYQQQVFKTQRLLWFTLVMLCATSEPFLNTPFFLIFPMSGLVWFTSRVFAPMRSSRRSSFRSTERVQSAVAVPPC